MHCGKPFLTAPTHPWSRCTEESPCSECAKAAELVEVELIEGEETVGEAAGAGEAGEGAASEPLSPQQPVSEEPVSEGDFTDVDRTVADPIDLDTLGPTPGTIASLVYDDEKKE